MRRNFLFQYVKKEPVLIIFLFIVNTAMAITITISVYLWKIIYDKLFESPDKRIYLLVLALYVSAIILCSILKIISDSLMTILNRRFLNHLRNDFTHEIMQFTYGFFLREDSGTFVRRITEDCKITADGLTAGIMGLFNLFQVCFWLIFFLFVYPWASLVYLIMTVLLVLWIFPLRKRYEISSYRIGKVNDLVWKALWEIISGIKTIKLELLKTRSLSEIDRVYKKLSSSHRKNQFYSNMMWNIFYVLPWLATGSFLVLLAGDVAAGSKSVGILVMCFLFTERFLSPLNESIQILVSLQGLRAAGDRLKEYTHQKKESSGVLVFTELKKSIEFQNISFSYPGSRFKLNELNLSIEKGQNIALFGKSGSGKSTIASLLVRLQEPDSGTILIDGQPLEKYRIDSIRNGIILVPQDIGIFHGTIRSNIDLKGDLSSAELSEVISAVRLEKFIRKQPSGLDTLITVDGLDISGGERQRLGIARAMAMKGSVIVYDEATASLDKANEREITNLLYNHSGKLTTVTITHNPRILKYMDKTYHLKNNTLFEGLPTLDDIKTAPVS